MAQILLILFNIRTRCVVLLQILWPSQFTQTWPKRCLVRRHYDEVSCRYPRTLYHCALYLSSTDAFSMGLSYLSDTLRLFLQTIAGENMEEQTSPIDRVLIQCMRAKDLHPLLYIDLVIQIHHHYGSTFLIDSLHDHQLCSSYKEVHKCECSSAVAKCWHTLQSVQSICCCQYWPKFGNTRLPTHYMEWMLLHMLYWVGPQSGDSYAELWKWMSYKQLATTTFAVVWLFSVGLYSQRH